MTLRQLVTFDSTLPYDGIEDETGFIQWPGKTVAEELAEILRRLGYTRIAFDTLDEAGYEVSFTAGKLNLAARVTEIDTYTVSFYQYSFFDNLRKKPRQEYVDILRRINDELNSDVRFSQVRWFADDKELFGGFEGALCPVEE